METVTFNSVPASVSSWAAGSIAVTVPAGATSGNVVVITAGSFHGAALPPLNFALSLGAFANGNPSDTGAAARPWYFIVTFKNDFYFTPDTPFRSPIKGTVDISSEAAAIKAAMIDALKAAYSGIGLPVVVSEGTFGTGDVQLTVLNAPSSASQGACGNTDLTQRANQISAVFYGNNMSFGQEAIQIKINSQSDAVKASTSPSLMKAIGRGLGNIGAHELAHQFLVRCCGMDDDLLAQPDPLTGQVTAAAQAAARATLGTYDRHDCNPDPDPKDLTSDPSPWTGYWKDGVTPIHWEDQTKKALDRCLRPGWHAGKVTQNCNENPASD
jgi:hypothetical protein